MDGLLVLLGLVVLAIPVAVIVLLVGQSRLKSRVAVLEGMLAAGAQGAPGDRLRVVLPPVAGAAQRAGGRGDTQAP